MTGVIATIPKFQFSNATGTPLANGSLTVYIAGTTTLTNTFQDYQLISANTNPVILDSRGECVLWLDSAVTYKFVLKNSSGVVQWTLDNLIGSGASTALLEAALLASGGSAKVGFLQAGTGAVSRTLQDKERDIVNIFDFMTDAQRTDVRSGAATLDVAAAIQSAINSGAKVINGPSGCIYKISTTLVIDADKVTLNLNYSELLLDDSSGIKSHIKLGNGSVQRSGIKLQNIIFTRQQVATSGYAIDSDFISVCDVTGCRIFGNNKIYRGIHISRGIIINIQNNYIDNCINRGIYLEGTGTGANRTVDVSIRENRVEGGVTALETANFVEGLFCRDNIFFNASAAGVVVDATSNANGLVSFKFQDNDFDTCGGSGLYIDKVSNVQVTGCWFSANTGNDLVLKEFTDGMVVVANQFYPNASAIQCFGNAARINANLISGGTTCITVSGSATRTDISGNTLSNSQNAINLGGATNVHFVGNSIYQMSAGTVSGTVGLGTVIQSNKGDSSVGSTSFISVGASPFTYTAGARPESISIFSGTVSNIQFGANSIGFTSNRSATLSPNQSIIVTYSSVPSMVKNIL